MENRSKVVDPTGAGNSFMGGVGAALHQGLTLREGESMGAERIDVKTHESCYLGYCLC